MEIYHSIYRICNEREANRGYHNSEKVENTRQNQSFFRERALVAITVATEFGASVQPLTNTAIETRIADGIVVRKALSMEVLLYDS